MSQKERDRLSLALCIVPRHSACHLTFDCGNLSLHLHGLIFSTHVGSCHGIEFSCHYMGPPVLLLSHYPIASVRMYTGLSLCVCVWPWSKLIWSIWCWTKTPHDQSAFDQIMPPDHLLTLSWIRWRPESCTNTHTHAHTAAHIVVHAMLGLLSVKLSLYQSCTRTHLCS